MLLIFGVGGDPSLMLFTAPMSFRDTPVRVGTTPIEASLCSSSRLPSIVLVLALSCRFVFKQLDHILPLVDAQWSELASIWVDGREQLVASTTRDKATGDPLE